MRKGRRAVHENTLCSTGGTGYAEDGGQTLPIRDFRHLTNGAYYLRQA